MVPKFSDEPLVPEELLKKFHCSCAKNCSKKCGCRKLGLTCNRFCKYCKGQDCLNNEKDSFDEDPDDGDVCDSLVDLVHSENFGTSENLEIAPDFSFLSNNDCEFSDDDECNDETCDGSETEIPCKKRK